MPSMRDLVARNRRNTWILVFFFAVMLVVLGLVIGGALGSGDWASAIVGAAVAGTLAFFMVLFGFFGGDRAILAMSGAKQIQHEDHPLLFNVVEEMAIASGMPMPKVYIIHEDAPNAFAVGRDPEHASVAITTGLLNKLNRDEVQGVMAHEMSHVRNNDIKLAMLMAVLVGTVVMISHFFLRSLWWGGGRRSRSSSRDGGGQAKLVLMLVGLVFAILAPIFAKLIQLAVSREREYLADASAAELTRLPEGLANALEKMSADHTKLAAANGATVHLYIVNPNLKLKGGGTSIWSTHPPTEERIRRLREMK